MSSFVCELGGVFIRVFVSDLVLLFCFVLLIFVQLFRRLLFPLRLHVTNVGLQAKL